MLEMEIPKRAEQTSAFRNRSAVRDAAKFGTKIENVGRQRPVQCEVTTKLGIAHEADEQHTFVDAIRRRLGKPITPKTTCLPGWPLVPRQADDVGRFARFVGKLKISEDDLLKIT
jgi:hypothetical protein